MRLLGGEGNSPIFLDTETTGLSGGAGTLAMLVGVGKLEGNRFRVTQYYMSDYDQEEDMLAKVERELQGADLLVTYNGKTFDGPLLRSRFVMHRRPVKPLDLPHIDLLHGARRVYRKRLHACSLVDIESQVLGIERDNDLPGSEVPQMWFRYVKTGEQSLMDEILRHNEQDIVSLALLLHVLCGAYRDPDALRYRQDTFSVGRAMERLGEGERAARFYAAAGGGEALTALGRLNKRNRRYAEAVKALENAVRQGVASVEAFVELAMLEEHQMRDYPKAMRWVDAAFAAAQTADEVEALLKRRKRLSRKILARVPEE
jgi:tetratricopeptide (TPR) repeat protein